MAGLVFTGNNGGEVVFTGSNAGEVIFVDGVPTISPGSFPPAGPTSVLNILYSYLYVQYNDDESLQAFVASQNQLAQGYLDFMNTINLPVYTSDNISGSLLDWVAAGLYGIIRPALPYGNPASLGPFNTYAYNTVAFNGLVGASTSTFYATSDDTFKRMITWNFYKGDGYQFNVKWLKRRVMRFLYGVNGTDPGVNQTYRISVSFGTGAVVNIQVVKNRAVLTGSTMFNTFAFNTKAFNAYSASNVNYPSIPEAPILKAAIESGALQLPFQFTYVVTV